jgi:hypothetical protein
VRPHRPSRREQLTLRRADRDAQARANLLVRQALDIVQDEHGPVAVGQARDGDVKIKPVAICATDNYGIIGDGSTGACLAAPETARWLMAIP